jgi:hypothetical protein
MAREARERATVLPDGRLIDSRNVVQVPKPPPLGFDAGWWKSFTADLGSLAAQARAEVFWLQCLRKVKKIEAARKPRPQRVGVLEQLPGEAPFDARVVVAKVKAERENLDHAEWCLATVQDARYVRSGSAASFKIEIDNRRRAKSTHAKPLEPYTVGRGRVRVDVDKGTILASGRPVVGFEISKADGVSLVASAAPARVDSDREAFALRALDVIDRLAEDLSAAS